MSPFMPTSWRIPRSAIELSMTEMARDGRAGCEGVALWLGSQTGTSVTVARVVVLRGPGVFKRPDYLRISAELLNDVADVALECDCYLVGQVHSHPIGFGVDLSVADRRYGISINGYLSVVAPDFAQRLDAPIEEFGFHVFDRGQWRRFVNAEREQRIEIVDGEISSVVAVGAGT